MISRGFRAPSHNCPLRTAAANHSGTARQAGCTATEGSASPTHLDGVSIRRTEIQIRLHSQLTITFGCARAACKNVRLRHCACSNACPGVVVASARVITPNQHLSRSTGPLRCQTAVLDLAPTQCCVVFVYTASAGVSIADWLVYPLERHSCKF